MVAVLGKGLMFQGTLFGLHQSNGHSLLRSHGQKTLRKTL